VSNNCSFVTLFAVGEEVDDLEVFQDLQAVSTEDDEFVASVWMELKGTDLEIFGGK